MIAFLMLTAALILLLGFEYDSMSKHVFHVYPLPAYAVVALWMALGFAWLAQRLALRPAYAATGAVAMLALVLGVGSRSNLLADYDWAARYARAVIQTLPRDAILFVKSDLQLGSIGYFHIVEGWRPDITLFNSQGLILGNRLFHPLRVDRETAQRRLRDFIAAVDVPVVSTSQYFFPYGQRDRWLYIEVQKSKRDAGRVIVDIPEAAMRFFEESLVEWQEPNAWAAFLQSEMRRRYALLIARSMDRNGPQDARVRRHVGLLSHQFAGALGLADGMMAHPDGYSIGAVAAMLERARVLMPSDVNKDHLSRLFQLRAALRLDSGDRSGAIEDFETALTVWPSPNNPALAALEDLYRIDGREDALQKLRSRAKRPGTP